MNETPVGLYGRIGTATIVNEKAREAVSYGAQVKCDRTAGTVEATCRGEIIFKALRKGAAGQPWLVMYNPKFYPKN
jgi:hypothetical protein